MAYYIAGRKTDENYIGDNLKFLKKMGNVKVSNTKM